MIDDPNYPGEFEPTPEYLPPCWHFEHTAKDPCDPCRKAYLAIVKVALGAE